jgi:hypothetical protein
MAKTKSKTVIRRQYKLAIENLKEAAAALYGKACVFEIDVLLKVIADSARKGAYSSK